MEDNLALNHPESDEYDTRSATAQILSRPAPGGALLRWIGHTTRCGGALWGLRTAEEYLAPGDPLLEVMKLRLSHNGPTINRRGDQSLDEEARISRATRSYARQKSMLPEVLAARASWSVRKHTLGILAGTGRRKIQSSEMPRIFRNSMMRSYV